MRVIIARKVGLTRCLHTIFNEGQAEAKPCTQCTNGWQVSSTSSSCNFDSHYIWRVLADGEVIFNHFEQALTHIDRR